MDKRQALKIAKRYIKSVARRYPFEKVFLFGSYVTGTNHEDSDIDLAIVFNTVDDIIDMQADLLRMRTDNDLMIEPHPFSLSDFDVSNPVVYEIVKNGVELETV